MTVAVLLVSIALAACIVFFARRRDGYSHLRQTISELGERGSADGRLVSLGVFLPVGIVLAAVAVSERSASDATAALAGAIAVGYCGAAVFPCDPGSPLQGSSSQGIHNLAGGVEYIGGALALWKLGAQSGALFHALAVVVAAAVAFLSFPAFASWRGGVQRVGELALFVGLALAIRAHGAG